MKKRLTCLLLALCFIFLNPTVALATSEELANESLYNEEELIPVSEDLEIYLIRVSSEALSSNYFSTGTGGFDIDLLHNAANTSSSSPNVSITKLDLSSLKKSADPILQRTLTLLHTTVSKGFVVHSVNIVLPYNESTSFQSALPGTSTKSNDPDDLDYWIDNTTYWGTYRGQDFRYIFHSFSISKPKADVANTPSTWPNILSAVVKVAVDRFIESTKFDTIYNVISDIQSVLGAATPTNYIFDSDLEWVKSETVGTLTYMDIFLEDIDDKISGYAYYIWGSLQQLQYQTRLEVKYYGGSEGGSPIYPTVTSPYSTMKFVKSRYYNLSSVFSILREYYDYFGYTMYSESVDLNSITF